MYHKIRIAAVSLVVMTVVMLSSVGTLSYFTDSDGAQNDFMIGNAKSELVIYDDVVNTPKRELSSTNYPPLESGNQDIPYYLQATNIGNIPVYQRFRVVIPIALAEVLTLKLDNCTLVQDATNTDVSTCSNTKYNVTYDKSVEVENVPTYAEYYIVSNEKLAVNGTTSEWPTTAIEFGDFPSVENWDSFMTCGDNSGNNCSFGVKAYSDVIQTTGFINAEEAFRGFAETYN